jgi:hypothetical protein
MRTSWSCPEEWNGEPSERGKVRSKSQTASVSRLTNHRYANMDFILFNSLIGAKYELLLFSYDIACQWSRKLSLRQVQLPNSMRLSDKQLHSLRLAIPKFHISAHGLDCQSNFSFNYQPHMARTDGEDPERWWAHINPVSMSTKEMGPGARLDTLDDHAAAWNWRKITGFGTCFRLVVDSFAALISYSLY